jgi:hypothetical protein
MSVKVVYKTIDGTLFDDKEKADSYDAQITKLKTEIVEEFNKLLIKLDNITALDSDNRKYEGDEYLGLTKSILFHLVDGSDYQISSLLRNYTSSND